ncbi:amidohydrolase family protein [Streptomyces torulosus]|uniref:amidohydrolase family protein n=1 Tax=Streptomyces torulosus TaxID=68276 RepID=UPI0006EB4C7D
MYALRALTIEGVRAVERAEGRGSLEPGKYADFMAFDRRNLYEVLADDIGDTKVVRTVFEGCTVHALAI